MRVRPRHITGGVLLPLLLLAAVAPAAQAAWASSIVGGNAGCAWYTAV